jgi:hypothetical protein
MRPIQQDSVAILPDMQPSKEISQTNEKKKLILLSPHRVIANLFIIIANQLFT